MAYETVIYEKKGHVATVTMNRPQALNATNNQMHNELYEAWRQGEDDEEVRVFVFTGAGRAFQSGADMKEASQTAGEGEQRRTGHWGFPNAANVTKPIVAAVNGMCAGGGLIFLGQCDVIIAADNAQFFDPHVSVGWLPLGETLATAKLMPFGLAMRIALMGVGERMNAQRAYEVGMVSELVPLDRLMPRAAEIAENIGNQAPLAVRGIKEAMYKILWADIDELDRKYGEANRERINRSEDGREGPRAFAQKRQPQWKGK